MKSFDRMSAYFDRRMENDSTLGMPREEFEMNERELKLKEMNRKSSDFIKEMQDYEFNK